MKNLDIKEWNIDKELDIKKIDELRNLIKDNVYRIIFLARIISGCFVFWQKWCSIDNEKQKEEQAIENNIESKYQKKSQELVKYQEEFRELNYKLNFIIDYNLNYAQDKSKNEWYISNSKYIELLEKRLFEAKNSFLNLNNNKLEQKEFLISRLKEFKKTIDLTIDYEEDNLKLFDYYCTLIRIQTQREYFMSLSWSDFFDYHVILFWWNWEIAIKKIIQALKLKQDYNFQSSNALKYKDLIDKKYEEILSNTKIKKDTIYWKIMTESLFNPININRNWIWWVWIWMNTMYIYWWKDKVWKEDKQKYIFKNYTNPLNPEENIQRSFEYVLFLYKKFKKYENKSWYNIEQIVFTAYNYWHNRVNKIIKENWINWHKNIKNQIANSYYIKLVKNWKKIKQIYEEEWV